MTSVRSMCHDDAFHLLCQCIRLPAIVSKPFLQRPLPFLIVGLCQHSCSGLSCSPIFC